MSNLSNGSTVGMAEIRALNRDLVAAQDEKILRVLEVVDRLPQRGPADALIAPLRPRLAQIRPRRPLGAVRLLFMPLDPVLVAGPKWKRGALAIPRTAIPSLVRQVEALAPGALGAAEREVTGAFSDEAAVVRRVGIPLWAVAGPALAAAPPPADWLATTGLNEGDHRAIRDAVALVLTHAATLHELADATVPDRATITALLSVGLGAPDAMAVLIAVLLDMAPHAAAEVLRITSAHSAPTGLPGRNATERAVERALGEIEAEQDVPQDPASTLPRLRRTVTMLDQLEASSADRPTRSARIAAVRAKVDAVCRARFDDLLRDSVVERLRQGMPRNDVGIADLEEAARAVRRMEHVARRINRSDHYDQRLRTMVNDLAPAGADAAEARMDRLRLAEILLGPERAVQMMMEST